MVKKKVAVLLSMAILASALAGCGQSKASQGDDILAGIADAEAITEQKLPLSEEKVTLKVTRGSFPGIRNPLDQVWVWNELEKKTNVDIEWEELSGEQLQEQMQLKIASGEMPDVFYQANLSLDTISNLIEGGYALPLNDLIDKFAPNIKALFEKYPEVKSAITWPDGNIYSLPHVDLDVISRSARTYINQDWLDNLGLQVPQTMEEFRKTLIEFRDKDANGNGDPNDEIPYGPYGMWMMDQSLYGVYGLANKGLQGLSAGIDMGDDGKVRYIAASEQYRELLRELKLWVDEGLLFEEGLVGVEGAKWQQMDKENKIGSYPWAAPNLSGDETAKKYTAINALEGPEGDKMLNWVDHSVRTTGAYLITTTCKNPIEAIKWIDYLYGDEGTLFLVAGEKGVTYDKVGDKYEFIGDVKKDIDEKGLQLGANMHLDRWYGGYDPGVNAGYDEWFKDQENAKAMFELTNSTEELKLKTFGMKSMEEIESVLPEEVWPAFIPTNEEAIRLGEITPDLTTYVGEAKTLFLKGELDLDKDWDAYIAQLEKLGYKEFLEIKQAQYERYSKQ